MTDLSGVDIVIFAGCSAAANAPAGEFNITQSAAKAGASVAVGWEVNTSSGSEDWFDYFFGRLNNGYTAQEAVVEANRRSTDPAMKMAKLSGDETFRFQ